MVEIKPFKGLRYDLGKVKDYRLVVTPPYDVISQKEKEEFLKLSDYNMVRLILADSHAKAAQIFREWQAKGILKKDSEDSIYIYRQIFGYNGKKVARVGFISLVRIEPFGKNILPHEKILEKPFKDRLELLNATKANFGCIFMLYDDREKIIEGKMEQKMKETPTMDFTDGYGITNSIWKVSDPVFISDVKEQMKQYQCVIADGHHRYTSCLKFHEAHPEIEGAKYALTCFVNSFNTGLFVLPIDRLLFNISRQDISEVLGKLNECFEVTEVKDVNELIAKIDHTKVLVDKIKNIKNNVFGMYCFSNKGSYFLRLKKGDALDKYYPDNTPVYRKLDINILHKLIFQDIFGISEVDQQKGTYIEYTKGSKRALDKLESDKYQFAFFINAPLMREIFLTARANETMPQKSTYFYPKIYSGNVINQLE